MNWYIVYKGKTRGNSLTDWLDKAHIEYYEPKRVVEVFNPESSEMEETETFVISNLIFIHTNDNIYNIIKRFVGLRYPFIDHMTGRPAVVKHKEMKRFIMSIEKSTEQKVEEPILLQQPYSFFSRYKKVKIIGGSLEGMEGYVVRVRKDRKLVISLGTMAVAVSGLHRWQLKPIEEDTNRGGKLHDYQCRKNTKSVCITKLKKKTL